MDRLKTISTLFRKQVKEEVREIKNAELKKKMEQEKKERQEKQKEMSAKKRKEREEERYFFSVDHAPPPSFQLIRTQTI